MENNIIIEKIWSDEFFFSVKIKCVSEIISAITEVYISNENLQELYRRGNAFLVDNSLMETYWESGTKGDSSTACISFKFIKMDKQGHIRIEVFMELDDGGKLSEHTCRFFVHTEIQQLYDFVSKLPRIVKNEIGYKVALNKNTGDGSL